MQYGPEISDPRPPQELLQLIDAIIKHCEAGKSFGLLTKFTHGDWFEFAEQVRIGDGPLKLNDSSHLYALRALLRLQQSRFQLIERWERQIERQGGLARHELGEKPEQVCKQLVPQIRACLNCTPPPGNRWRTIFNVSDSGGGHSWIPHR
jgi:hypothetical protein